MADTYTVEIQHQGTTHTIDVPSDRIILDVALEQGLELPYSCSAGVCTTCAALISDGEVDQGDAAGIGRDIQKQGYVLLCSAYPRSNLKIETEKEDEVYHLQFGQFQS
ncbi:MAG: 2Fe-2S iron-sulfur cluster-binding protein [Elainellaceae cyanobacterium]